VLRLTQVILQKGVTLLAQQILQVSICSIFHHNAEGLWKSKQEDTFRGTNSIKYECYLR
jgi:hypothetical protein